MVPTWWYWTLHDKGNPCSSRLSHPRSPWSPRPWKVEKIDKIFWQPFKIVISNCIQKHDKSIIKPVNRRYSRKSILDTLKSINTRAFSSRFIPLLPHVDIMLKNGKNQQPSPSSVTAVVFQVRDVLPQKRASIPHPRGRHWYSTRRHFYAALQRRYWLCVLPLSS